MKSERPSLVNHFVVSNLLALTVVLPMMLAALIVGAAVYGIERLTGMRWYFWWAFSPLIYMAWLVLHLAICAAHSKRMGRRHPKPRRIFIQSGADHRAKSNPNLLDGVGVVISMFRASFNTSLPLVRGLEQIIWFKKLVLRSYSGSVHIGFGAAVWSLMMDPDLTEVGERAIVGWAGEITAHVLTTRPDGSLVYVSAPIKIGARATIGGNCRVGLGVTIGEDAVVEPMSFVAPFTNIPAGEIWGGVPAHRLRRREDLQPVANAPAPIQAAPSAARPATIEDELEPARQLVVRALSLKGEAAAGELSADNCPAWDSVGQIAIATALFDSQGISLPSEAVFRIRTLKDVAAALAGREFTAAPAAPVTAATPGAPVARQPLPAEFEKARRLVVQALALKGEAAEGELSADNCAAWDSVGQIAITTAAFDIYGVSIASDQVFRLRTLADVAHAISGTAAPASAGQPVPSPEQEPTTPKTTDFPDDLELLPLLDPAAATRALNARFSEMPAGARPLRVVIAASSTAQAVGPTMKSWGRAFGLELEVEFGGFNQITQTLLAPNSPFAANAAGVNIVLVDPTDRVFESASQAPVAVDELLAAIEVWTARQPDGTQTLVGTLPPQVSAFASLERNQYEQLRHQWRSRLENLPGVRLFDFAAVVEETGILAARSSENEVISRMPYSAALYQALAIALVRQIVTSRRSPAKVIAVDCDNTLWGGVVGEAGLDGIKLGADGSGRSFQLFQQRLKRLKERGLLLAVVSKNEEADVLRVFENHPDMVLRPDDIAAWRVNWKHKSENLQELAEEMNLGIDSFVFLDDDPAVRMEVSMRLPGVHVVPMPEEPARYCETIERLWLFDGAQATEADLKRTRMMQEEGRRRRERTSAASLEDYLAGLGLEVDMREPEENEWARVAQLTQRTNQFNLSLKRRTVEEVKALRGSCSVLIVRARDKFGDYGLVGICFLRNATGEIDTLLMSCRVLGRGVEDAFLHAIARTAASQGASRLTAPFVEGPRNQMVKDFLVRSSFREAEPNLWSLSIAELPVLPPHVHWAQEQASAESTR